MAERAAGRARHSRQCHGLAGPPVPVAYQVGQLLIDSGPGIPPVSDHAVYGAYATGGGLLYLGQTTDARRRLRDLPAYFTYPPS